LSDVLIIIPLLFISIFVIFSHPLFMAHGVEPVVHDSNLKVELIVEGLKYPTTMGFVESDDILVLEKDNGTVRRIINEELLEQPLLDLDVATEYDRGMIGIAVSDVLSAEHDKSHVFIYLTESENESTDACPSWKSCQTLNEPKGNRLYRYDWDGTSLTNPKLLLNIPAVPGPSHNGGAVLVGPDNNIYLVVGDVRSPNSQAQNVQDGLAPSGTSGILTITQDGKITKDILDQEHPADLYYAYGIRNSFGIDFDPITGNLWDTENGYLFGDEINLVEPGFNSGWIKVQGIWNISNLENDGKDAVRPGKIVLDPPNLEDFNGNGKYSIPELVWQDSVGLTAIRFLDSDEIGKQYKDDIFVGDFARGRIYHFELDAERTELQLEGDLQDRVVGRHDNIEDILFGEGFGSITDIEVGPDGFLYVLSYYAGSIYKISPRE
jgi:glucose/arabinose dehydrogenase